MNLYETIIFSLLIFIWIFSPILYRRNIDISKRKNIIALLTRIVGGFVAIIIWYQFLNKQVSIEESSSMPIVFVDVSQSVIPEGLFFENWYKEYIIKHIEYNKPSFVVFGEKLTFQGENLNITEGRKDVGIKETSLFEVLNLIESIQTKNKTRPLYIVTDKTIKNNDDFDKTHNAKSTQSNLTDKEALILKNIDPQKIKWIPVNIPESIKNKALENLRNELDIQTSYQLETSLNEAFNIDVMPNINQTTVTVEAFLQKEIKALNDIKSAVPLSFSFKTPEKVGIYPIVITATAKDQTITKRYYATIRSPYKILWIGELQNNFKNMFNHFNVEFSINTSNISNIQNSSISTKNNSFANKNTWSVIVKNSWETNIDFLEYDLVITSNIPPPKNETEIYSSLTNYLKKGGGMFMMGGEETFGEIGYTTTKLKPMIPVDLIPHKSAGDDLALLFVIDGSESFTKTGSKIFKNVWKIIESFKEQIGDNGKIATMLFSDDYIKSIDTIPCEELSKKINIITNWQAPKDLQSKQIIDYLTNYLSNQNKLMSNPTAISKEGIFLTPALNIATKKMQCDFTDSNSANTKGRIIFITDENDMDAISPETWSYTKSPLNQFKEALNKTSIENNIPVSIIAIKNDSQKKNQPHNSQNNLLIPWSIVSETIVEFGGTAHSLSEEKIPLVGEKRREKPFLETDVLDIFGALNPPYLKKYNAENSLYSNWLENNKSEKKSIIMESAVWKKHQLYLKPKAISFLDAKKLHKDNTQHNKNLNTKQNPKQESKPLLAGWSLNAIDPSNQGRFAVWTIPTNETSVFEKEKEEIENVFMNTFSWLMRHRTNSPQIDIEKENDIYTITISYFTNNSPKSLEITVSNTNSKQTLLEDSNGLFKLTMPIDTQSFNVKPIWDNTHPNILEINNEYLITLDKKEHPTKKGEHFIPSEYIHEISKNNKTPSGKENPFNYILNAPTILLVMIWISAITADVMLRKN